MIGTVTVTRTAILSDYRCRATVRRAEGESDLWFVENYPAAQEAADTVAFYLAEALNADHDAAGDGPIRGAVEFLLRTSDGFSIDVVVAARLLDNAGVRPR